MSNFIAANPFTKTRIEQKVMGDKGAAQPPLHIREYVWNINDISS
jgi:hypothetical protein